MIVFVSLQMFFEDNIDDAKYCGHLYGLGTSYTPNGTGPGGSGALAENSAFPSTAASSAHTNSHSLDTSRAAPLPNNTGDAVWCCEGWGWGVLGRVGDCVTGG